MTAHPNLEALAGRERLGVKRGLDNVRAMLAATGNPERSFPVILVGGTNGKGSTGAFLAHALREAGLVVGWTTSPHLRSVTERVWIDGEPVSEGALDFLLNEAFEAERAAGVDATYFELVVTSALLAFRMTGVEVAVVEVGLGGRWDATNATDPILSVLTSVGLDHQEFLGDTRDAVAREKLCIAREGRPLVLGPGLDPSWIAPLLEARPVLVPAEPLASDCVQWDHSVVEGHRVGLPGAHQVDNLATALEVLRQLRGMGFPLPHDAVWRGFRECRWPGRLWSVPGLDNVWFDGAHNPDGAQVLAEHALACKVRPHLVFGAMRDKDLEGMAATLLAMEPASLLFVKGEGERYADGERLRRAWGMEAEIVDLAEAARRLRHPRHEPWLVAGSLYLLGDLLAVLDVNPYAQGYPVTGPQAEEAAGR